MMELEVYTFLYTFQLLNRSRIRCSHSAQVNCFPFSVCFATEQTARWTGSGSGRLGDLVLCSPGQVNVFRMRSGVMKQVRSLVGYVLPLSNSTLRSLRKENRRS